MAERRDGSLRLGQQAETAALRHLEGRGLVVVERNFRCRGGEIDLIMRDGDAVVFVEVRFRSGRGYGSAAETVDRRKQGRIILAAQYYLLRHPDAAKRPCRFDVVAIGGAEGIDWIQNAFGIN